MLVIDLFYKRNLKKLRVLLKAAENWNSKWQTRLVIVGDYDVEDQIHGACKQFGQG